jgi:ABC-type polysaccharide/polyol phosphate transport system ATPase subunit
MSIERGRVQAVDLGRRFTISSGGGRSLKATLLRQESVERRDFWALRHIDVDIQPGETFGIVGQNGSGKSTFLKMLARIFGPSEGHCQVGGRLSSLLELGAGFHPEFSAIENIYLAGAVYGIPKKELKKDTDEIIEFAELERFAHQPIKTFSSGMFMRLGFSVAMHVRPDVLLLDEAFAVGDERFVHKCLDRISRFRREGGTMLLVTHDPGTVRAICGRAMLLDHGHSVDVGPAGDIIDLYHERLLTRERPLTLQQNDEPTIGELTVNIRTIDSAGDPQEHFVEGEQFAVVVEATSRIDIADAVIRLSFKDGLGFEIGVCLLRDIAFTSDSMTEYVLEDIRGPLRDGHFSLEVVVMNAADGSPITRETAQQIISIQSHDADHWGPVRIEGTWRSRAVKQITDPQQG